MKLKHLNQKLDINLKIYFFVKILAKVNLTINQLSETLEICSNPNYEWEKTIQKIDIQIDSFKGQKKKDDYYIVIELIQSSLDLRLFIFSLKLYLMSLQGIN